jgi:hypothetical protein
VQSLLLAHPKDATRKKEEEEKVRRRGRERKKRKEKGPIQRGMGAGVLLRPPEA